MPDICDQSENTLEIFAKEARARARAKARKLPPTGRCHYCNEPLPNYRQLFCDKQCADDHAWLEQRSHST